MLSAELLREQVAAVITILSKTAIVEICKIIDSSFTEVYREVCLKQNELEVLRTKVRSRTGQGRAHTEWSNFGNITPPRRSIAIQVSSEQEVAECSASVGPLAQRQDVMEVIVKVEEGDEQGSQETPRVNPDQSESSTHPHVGPNGANQLRSSFALLYRHSSALLPAAFSPVKQEEGVPTGKGSHGETTLPLTHTYLKHSQDSAAALTHTQEEPLWFGELQLELKAEQEEEEVDQKLHAVPSRSSPNLLLPLPSSTSSEPPSSSATRTPKTAESTAPTETATQASVSLRPFHCSSCPKTFCQMAALKRHELSHSDVRLFDCDVCGKSFKLRANLQQHKFLHSGSKPFACSYCGKCFSHPSNMKTHQRIHTGERPYLCSTCGQTFNQHATLTRHQKRRHQGLHSGNTAKQLPQSDNDKPFPCHYCEQRFTNMSDRKKHQRIHTGERPYQCSECGLTFTQISHLTRHQKRLHSRNSAH